MYEEDGDTINLLHLKYDRIRCTFMAELGIIEKFQGNVEVSQKFSVLYKG